MKLWNKIIGVFLGLSMAVGIGVAISTAKEPLQVSAADNTYTINTDNCGWSTTGGAQSGEPVTGITISTDNGAYNVSNNDFRVYKNNTLTVTSTIGNIQTLAFTFSGSNTGGWSTSYSPNAATWTSPSATNTQARIKSLVVTIGSDTPTPPGPTPTPTSDYILTPTSGSNSSYAGNCDMEIEGITWNLTGNSQMQPWRIGGKSITDTNRELYSETALEKEIYKIEVTHGSASSITVNSWTVIVASDAEFEDVISTLTPTFVANDTTEIDRPSGVSWNNAYYKFIYNVTVSGSSNKFIEFTSATFYCEESSEDVEAWCESFLSTVTCDATGVTPPSKTAWSTMKTSFIALSDADKLTLKTLSNDATARYDYIVAKYGSSEYEDFIGRNPVPLSVREWTINPINETSVIPAIIIVSIAAITTIGVIITLKKKKVN